MRFVRIIFAALILAVSPKDEIFVADSVNGALVKFVKK